VAAAISINLKPQGQTVDRETFIAGFKRKLDDWNDDIDQIEERARRRFGQEDRDADDD
jgi:hypothetical protein